jgi:hypothetical protein
MNPFRRSLLMSTTLLDTASLTPTRAHPSATTRTARSRWAGRTLTSIAVLFLAVDATGKFLAQREAVEGTLALGWQLHHLPILGAIQLVCLALYLIPRTAPLGAVLWTGYLGGAIATHLRVDNPLFSHVLFPIYVAAFVWVGLYLRDDRVRALLRPTR